MKEEFSYDLFTLRLLWKGKIKELNEWIFLEKNHS